MKLLAGRAIDEADAADLLRLNASQIDRAYLERAAASLRVTDALRRCEDQARREEH